MSIKYKLRLKDLKIQYFKEYFSPIFNFFKPKKKIRNIGDLKNFIQTKSAWVTQMTLYGYLKTRMGAKYVLMFEDDIFLSSVDKAKWNIYVVAIQDLNLYCLSYLKVNKIFNATEKAKDIYKKILDDEDENKIPLDIKTKAEIDFSKRLEKINWSNHYKSLPFNDSALALYHWSPIADELKILDRKIVLNSMILKWDNIKKEFEEILNF
tara:strand:- start:717 stop:1343 length:627 start_codon:yes stop_codon:yes gene_type:complete